MTPARTQKLPPIPKSIPHILGPIKVEIVDNLRDSKGGEVYGLYHPFTRTIQLAGGMEPVVQWSTLWHERTHADIADIGVAINEDQEEAICNAIALCRVHEMLNPVRAPRRKG